ncbi:type II secretion system F family protein [Amaricoccus sp.]|uniref:type II secretion system F family protein n=1 Tax=Amaricoccus sp. TaxID=1872485 RepID=UPI00262E64CA|nr:type II secretion system F family protein [uncultured Amaricoccus sp.]
MVLTPAVIYSLSGTLILALLLSGIAMWVAGRRTRAQRVRAAIGKRSNRNLEAANLRSAQSQAWQRGMLNFMRAATAKLSIMKDRQTHDTRLLLVSAGYRSRDAIVVYTFFKLVAPLAFMAGAALYVYGIDPIGKGALLDMAAVMAAALFGSKLPDIILKNKRDKRLTSIRKALPDSLDMLVICAEAGLASDAALKRVVLETGRKSSVLSEELNQTAMELAFMPERRIALENLAERAPLPAVNAFVNTLIQAEKYGTPLARAFKVLSQEQRTERMLRAEEKAGRLPATMTVPMMIFILPALFIVLIGPAVLDIMDNFIGMK